MYFYGNIIYTDDKYTITDEYYMYRTAEIRNAQCYKIANIISGRSGFNKQYKGDYQLWIKAVRQREKTTIESYRRQAQELLDKAAYMEEMNGFKE